MTIDRAIEIFNPYSPMTSENAPSDQEIEESLHLATYALRFLKTMKDKPTCNTCAIVHTCKYTPDWGAPVRYNCPHYVKEEN